MEVMKWREGGWLWIRKNPKSQDAEVWMRKAARDYDFKDISMTATGVTWGADTFTRNG